MRKHTFEHVKQYFKQAGCELLEKNYVNNHFHMKYKCACGNNSEISLAHFKQGQRCKKCGIKKYSDKNRDSFEYVQKYFKNQGCELLEKTYKNNDIKLKYRCSCGNISKISFSKFKYGKRCMKCGAKKRSGEKHFNYNSNLTDEEREKNKTRLSNYLYKKWRTTIYKKDNFICKKCLQKSVQLNAHHIESWASNKELRLVESNGITFCEECHIKFHQKYGYKNNNRQQLNKFL